jgi:hypothetical protein
MREIRAFLFSTEWYFSVIFPVKLGDFCRKLSLRFLLHLADKRLDTFATNFRSLFDNFFVIFR